VTLKKHTHLVWHSKYVEISKVGKNTSLSERRVKATLKQNNHISWPIYKVSCKTTIFHVMTYVISLKQAMHMHLQKYHCNVILCHVACIV